MGQCLGRCCPLTQSVVVSDIFPYVRIPTPEESDAKRTIVALTAQVDHLSTQIDNQKFDTRPMERVNQMEGVIQALKFRIDCMESKNKFQDLLQKTPTDSYKLPRPNISRQSISTSSDSDSEELANAHIEHPLIEMSSRRQYEPPGIEFESAKSHASFDI